MSSPPILETPRLLLRAWNEGDFESFVAMTADMDVMRYVTGRTFSRLEAEANAPYFRDGLAKNGYGWWTVEVRETGAFAGFIGLQDVAKVHPCAPAIEVGWLLPRNAWGSGYATEGARAALDFGFNVLHLDEILALTSSLNTSSRNVMQRLNMTHNPADDFQQERVPADSPLRTCVVYRLKRSSWVRDS